MAYYGSLPPGMAAQYGWGAQYGASGTPMPTNTGSDKYAQNMRAWLAREEWADYQQRFAPIEQRLIDETMGRELLDERLSAVQVNQSRAQQASAQMDSMLNRRYGIQPSTQQRSVMDTGRALDVARGTADAKNNLRTHVYDRNMAVLGGGGARADIRDAYEG